MPLALAPISPSDVPRLITIYFAAFQNPHSLACWPRTPGIRKWWEDMVYDELKDPDAVFLKVINTSVANSTNRGAKTVCSPGTKGTSMNGWEQDECSSDGREGGGESGTREKGDESIVAWAKWVRPKDGQAPDTSLPEWPAEADAELCEETFGHWALQRLELMGTRGHWYLEMLATHPAHQGRGAGGMLMRYGLESADVEGKEAYLDASPVALGLYKKYGFEVRTVLDTVIRNLRVEGGKEMVYRNSFMVREPRTNEGSTCG